MTALIFIIKSLLSLLVTAFLLRVLLPLCRADARNPFSQAIIRFTNPLVLPLRRLLPAVGKLDTGALVALVVVQLAATTAVWLLRGLPLTMPALILLAAGHELLLLVLQFYFFAILFFVLLSWVAPGTYSPGTALLASLCNPLLRPVQRIIPPIAGIDFSAVFLLIAIQALQILLQSR